MRVLDVDEAELILDRLHMRVHSGTAHTMTNDPILQPPFWDCSRFWEGKWMDGYCSDL